MAVESDLSVLIITIGVDSLHLASFFMRHTSQLHMSGKEIFTARALAVCSILQLCLKWELRERSKRKSRYFSVGDKTRSWIDVIITCSRSPTCWTTAVPGSLCSAGICVARTRDET